MWMFLAMLLLAVPGGACEKGCQEYMGGVCACEGTTEKTVQTITPSDEKPRRGKRPEWETGEVNANQIKVSTTSAAEDYKGEKEQR